MNPHDIRKTAEDYITKTNNRNNPKRAFIVGAEWVVSKYKTMKPIEFIVVNHDESDVFPFKTESDFMEHISNIIFSYGREPEIDELEIILVYPDATTYIVEVSECIEPNYTFNFNPE